jgi:Zn-dependent protease
LKRKALENEKEDEYENDCRGAASPSASPRLCVRHPPSARLEIGVWESGRAGRRDSACQIPVVGNGADVKWSFRVATVAGIEVRIHATFVLLLGFYAWMGYLGGQWEGAQASVIFMLLLFLCVLLHEFGHAFAARVFGIRTPDITLLPIGGLARLEKMPSSPWQEFVIAVAGPAVNVVIVAVLVLVTGEPLQGRGLLQLSGSESLVVALLKVNCLLIAFNMIPAFPMDGGRVLRALLATRLRHSLATLVAARIGQGIAVVFALAGLGGFAGLASNPMLLIIGFFVFLGAQQELIYAKMREVARKFRVGEIMETRYETLPDSLPLSELSSLLLGSNQNVFPLVDRELEFRGFAERNELLEAARNLPGETPVSELGKKVETLHTETPLEEALEIMQKTQQPLLPVVNGGGQLVGLVDVDQLVELARGGHS